MKSALIVMISVLIGVTVAQAAPATFESPIAVSPVAQPRVRHQSALSQPGRVSGQAAIEPQRARLEPASTPRAEPATPVLARSVAGYRLRILAHWRRLEQHGRFDQP